jgi:hypothetical protein
LAENCWWSVRLSVNGFACRMLPWCDWIWIRDCGRLSQYSESICEQNVEAVVSVFERWIWSVALHGKCDHPSNTVTLIEKTKGFFCGDFTPLDWDWTTNNCKSDSSQASLVFSLKNPRNSASQKFPLSSGSNAIH